MSNKLIVGVGCGKGQRIVACLLFILWFVKLHITLKGHSHNHAHKTQTQCQGNEERTEDQYRDDLWMGGKWTGSGSSPGCLGEGELRPDLTGIRDRRLRGLGL